MSVSIISFQRSLVRSYIGGNIYVDNSILSTIDMGYNPASDCPLSAVEYAQQVLKPSVSGIVNEYAESLEGIIGLNHSLEEYIQGECKKLRGGITYVTYVTKSDFDIAHELLEKYNIDAIIIKEQNLMALSCEYRDDICCRIVYDNKYCDAHFSLYCYELLGSGFCSDVEAQLPDYIIEKTIVISSDEFIYYLIACATYLYSEKKKYDKFKYETGSTWNKTGENYVLKPWYAINDDPLKYLSYTARDSGRDMDAHVKAHHRMQELIFQRSMSRNEKRSMAQHSQVSWMMGLTRAARRALRGENDNSLDEKSRAWLERQLNNGLCDVFFVYRDWAQGPLQSGDIIGIICWFENGDKRYTTIDIGDDDKPLLIERTLFDYGYIKPELPDNSEQFFDVLMKLADIASYGPTKYWGDQFRSAASEVKKGNLLKAVNLSLTGGGMGSWYDTPMATMSETKELNLQLGIEREHAVMYAVNNS